MADTVEQHTTQSTCGMCAYQCEMDNKHVCLLHRDGKPVSTGYEQCSEYVDSRTEHGVQIVKELLLMVNPNKMLLPTMSLDMFTKQWCRVEESEDLLFRCRVCPFSNPDGKCSIKQFSFKFAPKYYENFGAMSR